MCRGLSSRSDCDWDRTVGRGLTLDYGKCIACQLCTESCPTDALIKSNDWAFGVQRREDLVWVEALASRPAQELKRNIQRCFGHSLHIRHVDAGSCNGCESELQALNNPYYNLHRLGIFFTPSPRFADLLLVTGSVTYAMREALLETYNAMPEPRWVLAMGTCAVSGGVTGGGYSCGHGIEGIPRRYLRPRLPAQSGSHDPGLADVSGAHAAARRRRPVWRMTYWPRR